MWHRGVYILLQENKVAEKVVLNQSGKTFKTTPEMFFRIVILAPNLGEVDKKGVAGPLYYKTPSN